MDGKINLNKLEETVSRHEKILNNIRFAFEKENSTYEDRLES